METSKKDLKIENKNYKSIGYTVNRSGSEARESQMSSSRSWMTEIPTRRSSEFSALTGLSDSSEGSGSSVISDEIFDSEVKRSNSRTLEEDEISCCSEDTYFDHPSILSLGRSEMDNYKKKREESDILWKEKVEKFLEKDLIQHCFRKSKVSFLYKISFITLIL